MKKCTAIFLILACFLALSGCYDVRTIDLGEVSAVELRSGLTGDVVEISDPEVVQKITDPIRELTFQADRKYDVPKGWVCYVTWLNGEGESVGHIQVLDEEGSHILYGGHCYRVKDDLSIDADYILNVIETQNTQ